MPKGKKTPTTCALGIRPGDRNGKCPDPSACAHCGWYPEEAQARAWAIRAIGLETGPDGLQRGWYSAGSKRQRVRRVPMATRRERGKAPEVLLLPPEQSHEG